MAFTENLDQFFDDSEFADAATFTRNAVNVATVKGIFDDPAAEVGIYEQAAVESNPRLQCRSDAIATVHRGDTVTVKSRSFKVEKVMPDSTGTSTVYLRNA